LVYKEIDYEISARVDPNMGRITQFRSAVKIAFGVDHEP
jgi:hypothetical protein